MAVRKVSSRRLRGGAWRVRGTTETWSSHLFVGGVALLSMYSNYFV